MSKKLTLSLTLVHASLCRKIVEHFDGVTFFVDVGLMGERKIKPELISHQDLIIDLISNGKTIKQIQTELIINPRDWWEMLRQDPLFAERMRSARTHAFEVLAESVLSIADDYPDPQRARVKLESIAKYLAWMEPAKFGARVDVNVTQTLDISGAIQRAMQRVEIDVTPKLNDINDLV